MSVLIPRDAMRCPQPCKLAGSAWARLVSTQTQTGIIKLNQDQTNSKHHLHSLLALTQAAEEVAEEAVEGRRQENVVVVPVLL